MNKENFGKLIKENQEPLRRFLLNLCNGNQALSDDIAQEAFIKAYLNFSSFRGESKFSSWLFRIAYNCFLDNLRKNRVTPESFTDEKIILAGTSGGDEAYSRKIRNEELYLALAQLKQEEKSSILLFYMEDKSIKEISKITATPENTVKSHLFRAKAKMSDYLIKIGYER